MLFSVAVSRRRLRHLACDDHTHAQQLGLEQFGLVSDEGLSLDSEPADSSHGAVAPLAAPESPDAAEVLVNDQDTRLRIDAASGPVEAGQILEALLFVGDGPISAESAAKLIRGVGAQEISSLIERLQDLYQRQGRPYEIAAVSGGYRFRLRDEFQRVSDRLYNRHRAVRVSPAAIEVLALIAYRQPINRQSVENLRGAECSGILRQLVRRGLLRISRNGSGSRDVLYHTTDRFLDVFQLGQLEELPRPEDLDRL